jgi:hypothetical protein
MAVSSSNSPVEDETRRIDGFLGFLLKSGAQRIA